MGSISGLHDRNDLPGQTTGVTMMTATSTASAMFLSIGRNLFDYYHFSVSHVVPCFIFFFFIRLSGMVFFFYYCWKEPPPHDGNLPVAFRLCGCHHHRLRRSCTPKTASMDATIDAKSRTTLGFFFELGADWAPGSATRALMMRLVAETFAPTGHHSNPQLFFAFQFQIHSNSKI